MRLHRTLFAALAGTHGAAVLVAPEVLAPAIAVTVYLPLLALKAVGIPVFAAAKSGGWASPSVLGWVAVFLFWCAIWWTLALLLSRLLSKRARDA